MKKSLDLKTMVKRLGLPGGACASLYPNRLSIPEGTRWDPTRYEWRKRGGYADAIFTKVYTGIKKNGFKEVGTDGFSSPDGSVVRNGDQYVKGRWRLELSKSFGVTKSDNYFDITLEEARS